MSRGAPSRALICPAALRTTSAIAGMLASSMRESGPETLMLATTVPVRSKTGPAHVSLGGDQRGEPTGQAVPPRLPAQFSYTATARVATSREVMDHCRPSSCAISPTTACSSGCLPAFTGMLTLLLRATPAYGLVLVAHLATIVVCFAVLPYTRFMHAAYRFLAIVADNIERRRPG